MPSLLEAFAKALPDMEQASLPLHFALRAPNHLLVQAASRGCDCASTGTC